MDSAPPQVLTTIKFTEAEVKEISNIRDGFDKAVVSFGDLYLQKIEMETFENSLKAEYARLKAQEKSFLDKIVQKYGEGSYDSTTGIYTPKK